MNFDPSKCTAVKRYRGKMAQDCQKVTVVPILDVVKELTLESEIFLDSDFVEIRSYFCFRFFINFQNLKLHFVD